MDDNGLYRVLLCEDDGLLRATLEKGLRRAGFVVDAVAAGSAAVERARISPPDAVVLDIGLPDADGRDVCQALRAQGCSAGVVFLTARDHTDDVLSGFAAGGDDYVCKPFEFAELLARVSSVMRRRPVVASETASDDESTRLRVDPRSHSIHYAEAQISLTPTEFRLIACLLGRRPDVVRRNELIAAGWPGSVNVSDNTVDQYVTRTRKKLRKAGFPATLENVRGVGYRLQ